MAKIKIEFIKHNLSKNGKTKLCSIKTLDKNGQEVWLGGFGNNTTESWQKGQTIELDVFQEEYNGTLRWKFKEPTEKNIFTEIERLEGKIDKLIELLSNDKKQPEVTVEECEKIFGKDPELNGSEMPDFLKP